MSDSTIDQQFIEYIVKTLVGNPDAVTIDRSIDEKGVLLLLTVDPEDLGRVIGKRGATAQSMRTLLRALGTKNESRYNLKIVDNGYPKPERDGDSGEDSSMSSPRDDAPMPSNETSNDSMSDAIDSSGDSEEPEQTAEEEQSETESAVERTRRELEDLDDLDI